MPFSRPSLSDLRAQVTADIAASLPGADPLLRFSNLRILATVLAGMSNLHYAYLDWVARQAVPFTATDEFLYAWGALKDVNLKAATFAGDPATNGAGSTAFSGCTPTTPVPAGSLFVRGDGVEYVSNAVAVIDGGGNATVPVTCTTEGATGNCEVGTKLVLGSSLAGINTNTLVSVALTGGADIETQDEFRSRMLFAYANPPQGGAIADYVEWAEQVPGVTRAWCVPLSMGAGSVNVFFMMDDVESAFGGFPQGTNGVATDESRAAPATGDQLVVANYIFPLRPVTALVYASAPVNSPTVFTINGITDPDVRTAIGIAIDDVFRAKASPGGTTDLLDIEAAIAAVPGSTGAVVTVPAANIVAAANHLSTRGAITWT